MAGAALGGKREQRHSRTHPHQLARQLRRGHRDLSQLLHGRVGDDTAVAHEQDAILAEAAVFDLHHLATGSGGGLWGHFDDLEQGPQDAAGDLVGAGNEAIGLVHRDHHGAEVIGLEHGLARFQRLEPLVAAQHFKAVGEVLQVLALGRIDDADAFEGNAQGLGDLFDFSPIPQKDGSAQPQRIKLARGLEHPRLSSFRKDNPFRMPLQLINNTADEAHGRSAKPSTARASPGPAIY